MNQSKVFFWFRRDLRLHDNNGFFQALNSGAAVIPVFIFDSNILSELPTDDRRLTFIYQQIQQLHNQLAAHGSGLIVKFGTPESVWPQLVQEYETVTVFANQDYEPYATTRDAFVSDFLKQKSGALHLYSDHLLIEPGLVLKDNGAPYTVFTPFSVKYKVLLKPEMTEAFGSEKLLHSCLKFQPDPMPALKEMGFEEQDISIPAPRVSEPVLQQYEHNRDYPAIDGTSRISVHLRFGTISVREAFRLGLKFSQKWTMELIWREFYAHILFHFPHVVTRSFKPEYDGIEWRNNEAEFEAWKIGLTGYPIVDAGMRELAATGYMHNRVRMVVSSFLCKHLLIDWRWGEAWFAEKLLDFDLSSNNGGWQWAAGCGVDAAPYFRIFNPQLQTLKFDPNLNYIKKWVPEWDSLSYPRPIVDHKMARERCLKVYKSAVGKLTL